MAGTQVEKSDAEMQINFSALKKHDPGIQQIIDTASSVAHYKFNSSTGLWEKTEVEGSLFLYSRKASPYVIIFIMNRLNKDNAKLTLTPEMEFKIQEPFLLCKASNSEIIGIWFYDGAECRRFGALLSRFRVLAKDERSLQISIMMEAEKNAKSRTRESLDSKNGIIGMFSQAQDEYSKSRSKFTQERQPVQKNNPKSKKQNQVVLHRGMSEPNLRVHSPTEKKASGHTEQKSPTDDREEKMRIQRERFQEGHKKEQEVLLNILRRGNNSKSRNRTVSSGGDEDSNRESTRNNNLRSNAGDLATFNDPFNELGVISEQSHNHVKQNAIDCAELESQFSKKIRNENVFNKAEEKILSLTLSESNKIISTKSTEKASNSVQFTSATSSSSGVTGGKSTRVDASSESLLNTTSNSNSASVNSTASTSGNLTDISTHLLSPRVMTSGKGRGTTLSVLANGQQNIALAANFKQGNKVNKKIFSDNKTDTKNKFPEAPSGASVNSLMAPAAFQLSTSASAKDEKDNSNATKSDCPEINKKDFQSVLLNMIQTDDEFVTKLHNTYLEQIRKR